ncbi:type VI secretion system membrane subunit TssM [Bordetella bronchiseptica]|uniref:type VI secretion system membrane subunit TssM n=1 Tax=Bordetella bronchiseptica TaxID=518 RepID=UPI000460F140|nr:type VI secretion system membrane subunit TssM [Bordetella bronchiseptica]KDC47341.1 type VI secretion protein IcmF [Bordetella bronchiseptica M85/00/2]
MIPRLFGWLFSRGLWSFLGLVALALLVWIAGPLLAIGALRPLESETARVLVIAALFAFALLRLLWRKWREGRLNAQLLGQLRRPARPEAEAAAEPPPSDLRELEGRFDEAVELLRKTRFDGGGGRGWLQRYSRQYLYQLPWYVIIGAPGSGKTTALVNSGLDFPLAERFGKAALRGVGGTRNCDWWFTDDAVLLDTAGRYTTHESDPTGDEESWRGFLGLLTRFRGRQPINGAMLTVSIEDLLAVSDAERARHAAVLRRRLQELREQLGIHFPVYVLVTKADLLAGFEQYFASFSREDLEQVWGFTLPYARAQEPDFDLYEAFHAEYRLLQRRLDDALPEVLAAEPDEARRALAYLLPQQFAGLQAVLGHFLSDVFASSRFEERLVPRGVYFTSGTQGGETFDQVTGHLKRYLRIESGPAPAAAEEGRSFFLKRLLQDVIFPEAGLAGRNLRWERRYRRLHWAGYGLITLAFLGLAAGWLASYGNNARYLDEVARRVPTVDKLGRDIKITRSGDVLGLMPFLDGLWYLPRDAAFEPDAPPLSYRFGLYQGGKMHAAMQGVYRGTLDSVLLPQVARRIEAALRAARADDLEYGYEALRAYLMLYEADHYDAEFMHAWLLSDMQGTLPEGYTRRQYDLMSLHLRQLAQGGVLASPFPRDEALVRQARDELARHTLAQRAYSRLRRMLAGADDQPPTTAVTLGGPQASAVFVRKSGKPLAQGIAALYTYRGYWDVFNPRVTRVAERLRSDDAWVLDIAPPGVLDEAARQQLIVDIKRLYLNDYVARWDGYLDDLALAPRSSLLQSIQLARTLSAPDSPLVRLTQGVARETTLLRDAGGDERSLADQARDRVSSTREALEQMFGPTGPGAATRADAGDGKLERVVDQHFEPWRRLARADGQGGAPIAATTSLVNELYTYLTAADAALRSASPAPASDVVTKLRAEAGRLPRPLRDVLDDLSTGAAGEVSGVARERLGEDLYATIGLFCRQAIAGRYPFAPGSPRDVAPNDLARLFAPNGMMDEFFQKNLVSQIDVSEARWRFKPGMDGTPGQASALLDSFQRAAAIRDAYFMAGSAEPAFRVSIRPVEMDPAITQFVMDVDGQTVRYAHGPQVATSVQWPGPRGANQVRIELTPQAGAAGLSASGPWALNRLLDQARVTRGASPEISLASFDIGGRKVVLEIRAGSVRSPFHLAEMRGFSCPGRS